MMCVWLLESTGGLCSNFERKNYLGGRAPGHCGAAGGGERAGVGRSGGCRGAVGASQASEVFVTFPPCPRTGKDG